MNDPREGRRTALITGASAGIGLEIARAVTARGFDSVLVARRRDRLEELAGELAASRDVEPLVVEADLATDGGPDGVARALERQGRTVDLLVNNAGLGQFGSYVDLDPEQEQAQLHVNVVALTRLTRLLLPAMVERGHGRVLNVASTAAFFPGPLMAVYYATKAYVLSYSVALAEETRGTGVTVTCVCPGPVETEFQEVAGTRYSKLHRNSVVMGVERVAAESVEAALAGRTVHVPGVVNKVNAVASRLFPRGFLAR
ncbi:MAG TPA: SDR family oxidoreductase, partial [Longimicrobiales bacterium]|nr:SDR family oxidoreductase [Longimicrobiales bacterium]